MCVSALLKCIRRTPNTAHTLHCSPRQNHLQLDAFAFLPKGPKNSGELGLFRVISLPLGRCGRVTRLDSSTVARVTEFWGL